MTGTSALPSRRQGGRTRTLGTLFAVLATLFAALTLVAPTPASAAGNGEWSVDPFVPDGTSQNARRYFFLEGAAGTTVPDTVTVHNTSPAPLTMKLFGADAYNTPRDGGFALRTVTDKQTDIGTWIQVAPENQTLTLQPGEKRAVPFNIVIPPNATPGDHPGAVVALNTAVEGTKQQGQIKVNIQRQIGARVYLRVQGDALPAVDIQKIDVERNAGFGQFFGSGRAKITYRIVNRGNVILRPKFDIEAKGLFGRELFDKVDEGTEILPGATVEKVIDWKDAPRLDHVTIKVSGGAADLNVKDSASVSYTAVPWPSLLTLAVLLLAGGLGWNLWRNNRKGGKGGDPAKPEGPSGPTDDTTVLPPIPAAPAATKAAEHAETSGEPEPAKAPVEAEAAPVPDPEPAKPAAPVGAAKDDESVESVESASEAPAEAEEAVAETPVAVADSGDETAAADDVEVTEGKAAEDKATEDKATESPEADAEPVASELPAAVAEAEPAADKPATDKPAEDTAAEADEPAAAPAEPAEQPAAAADKPAAAAPKKTAKRPKGKQPPPRPRADAPAAEEAADSADSADSAGVGR